MSAKHISIFTALSPVMVTAAGWLKNCSGGHKQINSQKLFLYPNYRA
jgi:hypothetical protein